MFRIPILITLAGITGLFLYKNEKTRVPVQNVSEETQQMLGRESLPEVSELEDDEYDSDESVTLSELNLRGD